LGNAGGEGGGGSGGRRNGEGETRGCFDGRLTTRICCNSVGDRARFDLGKGVRGEGGVVQGKREGGKVVEIEDGCERLRRRGRSEKRGEIEGRRGGSKPCRKVFFTAGAVSGRSIEG
jgi:hypothetical protein